MKNAATRELYCYWDALRGDHVSPERADVDPAAIRRVLADTFIVEYDLHRTFPYRLAGTRLCALMGHELRGESFLEAFAETERTEIERLVDAVIEESAAVVAGLEAVSNQGHRLDVELLMVPLRHRSPDNSRVLGSLCPAVSPSWLSVCPVESLSLRSVRILWPNSRVMFDGVPAIGLLPPGARRLAHLTVIEGGRA